MSLGVIASAALLGLLGSGHCVGMCAGPSGWIVGAAGSRRSDLLAFQAARIASYALLGALAAALGEGIRQLATFTALMRPVWTMLNVAAFVVGASLLLTARQPHLFDRFGLWLWRRVRPTRQPLHDLRAPQSAGAVAGRPRGPRASLVAGLLWGLMPCGLLYSALLLAVLAARPLDGLLAMAAFALASGVPLLAVQWSLVSAGRGDGRLQRVATRVVGAAICALAGYGIVATALGFTDGPFCLPATAG